MATLLDERLQRFFFPDEIILPTITPRFKSLAELKEWNTYNINPFTTESDKPLISPYSMTPGSNIKVMSVKEMISMYKSSWLLSKISSTAL